MHYTGWLWLALLTALFIALPPLLTLLYTSTIRTIHQASIFTSRGWVRRLFMRRLLRAIASLCFALAFGLLSVFWLPALTLWETLLLFAAIPVLLLIYPLVERSTRREVTAYAAHAYSLAITRKLLAALLLLGLVVPPLVSNNAVEPQQLAPAIEAIAAAPLEAEKSHLVQLTQRLFRHARALLDYAMHSAVQLQPLYLAIVLATYASLAFNFTLLISAFAIPPAEYRRIFAEITDAAEPPHVSAATAALVSALSVLSLFMLLALFAQMEMQVREGFSDRRLVSTAEQGFVTLAEQIDDALYEQGTLEALAEARMIAIIEQTETADSLREEARRAFAAMRDNVELYLDHYYSLPAEYMRVVGALSGNIEETIRHDLERALSSGQPFAALDAAILRAERDHSEILDRFAQRRDSILAANRITEGNAATIILQRATLEDIFTPPADAVLLNVNQRLGASGLGLLTGAVAAKTVSKIAANGGLKLAAKAIGKVGVTKLAGAGGGAVTGAAVSSMFPVVGTLIGGAVGAALGLAMGVSVDVLLLGLESYYSRDDFRTHIIDAINDQEREFLSLLE